MRILLLDQCGIPGTQHECLVVHQAVQPLLWPRESYQLHLAQIPAVQYDSQRRCAVSWGSNPRMDETHVMAWWRLHHPWTRWASLRERLATSRAYLA